MKPIVNKPMPIKLRQLTQSISLALLATTSAHSAEFIVTTTDDPGGGTPVEISPGVFEIATLRSAIEQADDETTFPGADTISFADSIFIGGEAEINLNIIGDSFVFGGTSNSAFGINSEITVAGPTAATLQLTAGDLRHFQINSGGQLNISHVTLDGGFVPDNTSGRGGSIYVRPGSSTRISNCTFTNNSARSGGALNFNSGSSGETSTVTNSCFMLNQAYAGGAVFQDSLAPVIISKSRFSENSSSNSGGALFTSGNLIIDSSTINNNTSGSGGGISGNNVGILTLKNSTVTNNRARFNGGGIELGTEPEEGVNVIINSTITGNQARFDRPPQITNISGEEEIDFDSSGGGINARSYVGIDTLFIHNSIIAGNTETNAMLADDVAALLVSDSSHNLIGAGDSVLGISDGLNGNQIGTRDFPIDAALLPLADNGGHTLTQLPNLGSPVIDAGDDGLCELTDQRGRIRPQDGNEDGGSECDIGAVEVGDVTDLIFKNGFQDILLNEIIFINGFDS